MTAWKIISHDDGHALVQFEKDGQIARLNVKYDHVIEAAINPVQSVAQHQIGTGMRVAGQAFEFDKGGVLPAHDHKAGGLHDIRVLEGCVRIEKESGNVIANVGDLVELDKNETHSVHGLAGYSLTLHLLKK